MRARASGEEPAPRAGKPGSRKMPISGSAPSARAASAASAKRAAGFTGALLSAFARTGVLEEGPVRFEDGRYQLTVPQLNVYAVVALDAASL